MPGDEDGAPWPDPAQGAPFTWGPSSDRQTTPQVRYATWGRRGVGFLVDFILMASAPIVFFVLLGISVPDTSNPHAPTSAISWVWFWCLLASCTLFVLYPVWFIGRRGQTPGMQQMQIRLFAIDSEGKLETPSANRAWGRSVTAAAAWFLFFAWVLDYLWPLGDRRHQCIHDKIARTVAVDVRSERGAHDGDGWEPADNRLSG
jgi:uncharacterized RDD family membrane protein YckC